MSTLTTSELRALAEIARNAARIGAAHVVKGWRTNVVAEHKGRVDLVTRFDRESEELLRDCLGRATSFPFIGEEAGGAGAREGAPVWYVDPLDGTTNFVHGHPFFCVSVGLVAGGAPLVGAVVAPVLRTEWVGVAGDASTRDGERCSVTSTERFGDALFATGFPYDRKAGADNNFEAFVAIKMKCQAVRRCGSAAIDLCFVADGTYDGYWEKRLQPWDVAAGAAIVLGAGGRVSAYDGGVADVTSGSLVASNGRVHDELVAELVAVGARPR